MGFHVVDHYPRRAHLEFYRSNPNPFYGVNFELDATRVRSRARELGASTYAALVWAYHRALLPIDAFRTRLHGDDVVRYDTLRVGMTVPAPDRTYTFAPLEWVPSAEAFLTRAGEAIAQASQGVDLTGGADPDYADKLATTYWKDVYPLNPASYKTPLCYDGGPLDLNPSKKGWP